MRRRKKSDRPIPQGYHRPRPGVLEPVERTHVSRYQALKRYLLATIKRSGFLRPDDYQKWYEQANVGALIQAAFPEIRRCLRCRKELEIATIGFRIVEDPDPSGPGEKYYCSELCRSQARTAKSRARNPEAKLRRR